MQMWLQSESCHWAGPDDFLYSAFNYVSGLPAPMYSYKNDALNNLMAQAIAEPGLTAASRDWLKAQDLIAADMPTVPLMNVKLPAAARKYVMGFVGSGNHAEIYNTVWLNK
jgi:ABC-type transport system substrate-binding protein